MCEGDPSLFSPWRRPGSRAWVPCLLSKYRWCLPWSPALGGGDHSRRRLLEASLSSAATLLSTLTGQVFRRMWHHSQHRRGEGLTGGRSRGGAAWPCPGGLGVGAETPRPLCLLCAHQSQVWQTQPCSAPPGGKTECAEHWVSRGGKTRSAVAGGLSNNQGGGLLSRRMRPIRSAASAGPPEPGAGPLLPSGSRACTGSRSSSCPPTPSRSSSPS